MSVTEQMIVVAGEQIAYELERKSVKRMNLRVRPDGSVHLSIPRRTSLSDAERFLREHADWIARARAKVGAKRAPLVRFFEGVALLFRGGRYTLHLLRGARRGGAVDAVQKTITLPLPAPPDPAACERVFFAFLKREACELFTARARALYPLFAPHPPTFPTVKTRWMHARWGSCHQKGQITLSERLMFVPPALLDFVICHELCHFTHPDHSAAFHRMLARFVPDERGARRALASFPIPRFARDE